MLRFDANGLDHRLMRPFRLDAVNGELMQDTHRTQGAH